MRSKSEKQRKAVPGDLSIAVEKRRGWHIIVLTGKFVVKTIALVRKQFDAIEPGKSPSVAVDLTRVTQLDSSALTTILNFQKRLGEKNGRVVVVGPDEGIRETLFVVGFNLAVTIYSTRTEFEQCIDPK